MGAGLGLTSLGNVQKPLLMADDIRSRSGDRCMSEACWCAAVSRHLFSEGECRRAPREELLPREAIGAEVSKARAC